MNGPSLFDIFVIIFTTKHKIAAQWRRFYLNDVKHGDGGKTLSPLIYDSNKSIEFGFWQTIRFGNGKLCGLL